MFYFKKNFKYIIVISMLLIVLAYITNITSIPNSLILFQDENLNLKTIFGVNIEETIPVGSSFQNSVKTSNRDTKKYTLSLLGFNLKTVTANVVENRKVIPLGEIAGLKLYTKGVLVVGMKEIEGIDNKVYKPYENTGIEEGDIIVKVNEEEINTSDELIQCVSRYKDEKLDITYIKGDKTLQTSITPVKTSANTYKIGLWVRDSAAGVGTLTFYDPNTSSIATLGHGIQDIDTEELVEISTGEIVTTDILNVKRGERNNPGKIEGSIEDSEVIANIYSNTDFGVYATSISPNSLRIKDYEEVEVASRNEIKTGKASIVCTLENGKREEYEVQIEKIYTNNNKDNRSMIVKVTDEDLISKTGGIIQGMSGSPIIQNGKLIGALTHVFVSDPSKGYGVFADKMLEQMQENT